MRIKDKTLTKQRALVQSSMALAAKAEGDTKKIVAETEALITEIEQTGYFRDTPTGECMEDAIKVTTFPQTQKASTTVNYPFVLR